MIADKTGLPQVRTRSDFRLFAVPVLETASAMGDMIVSNMVMLGAYIAITGALTQELIETELNKRYGDKQKALKMNADAFRKGIEMGKAALKQAAVPSK